MHNGFCQTDCHREIIVISTFPAWTNGWRVRPCPEVGNTGERRKMMVSILDLWILRSLWNQLLNRWMHSLRKRFWLEKSVRESSKSLWYAQPQKLQRSYKVVNRIRTGAGAAGIDEKRGLWGRLQNCQQPTLRFTGTHSSFLAFWFRAPIFRGGWLEETGKNWFEQRREMRRY